MNTTESTGRIFRLDAVATAALGVLLLLGTWDGLYRTLDLPHTGPAMFAQFGGALLIAFAYLLWVAPDSEVLVRAVGRAAALGDALGAVLVALWLIFRGKDDLGIGTQGMVELAVFGVILAAASAVMAMLAGRPATGPGAAASPAGGAPSAGH